MTTSFFQILRKSIKIIFKEPLILMPYLIFNLVIATINQMGPLSDTQLIFQSLIEWIVVTLVIQPFIILYAWDILKKKEINIMQIIKKQKKAAWPFFIVSLYKPIILFGGYKLLNIAKNNPNETSELTVKAASFGICLVGGGLIISMLTIYFQSFFLTKKYNQYNSLFDQVMVSIRLFRQFKWVSISFIIYMFAILTSVLILILGLFIPIIPVHLHLIFINMLHAIAKTFFYIGIFRLFLLIKPLFSLDYN